MSEAAKIQAELEARLGDVIADRYRLDQLIGVGGMGAVFRAHHLQLKHDVAVKVLHPDLCANEEVARRFEREGQSAARLGHPNIIDVKDSGTTPEGMRYMVMPVLEGEELVAMLGQPIAPERALQLIDQIFAGLEHAHSHGIIHRDLKPENVFVTTDHAGREVLKLVDFGIAKMVGETAADEESQPLTRLGLVFGTPQYMSPEQATGLAVDARTDLYSAGILLYAMLTGKPPFDNDDPIALVRMQVSVDPPSLAKLVPPAVADIVSRLLAKDRDERFSSATEARKAIGEAFVQLGGTGVPGEIPTLDDRTPVSALASKTPSGPTPRTTAIDIAPSSAASSIIERIKEQPRTRLIPVAVGVLILAGLLAVAVWPADDDDPSPQPTTRAIAPAIDAGDSAPDKPSEDELGGIRRALLAKNGDEALALIKPLRDRFPENAQLLWFEGHALALKKGKQSLALARYADALEKDPTLLDSSDFYAEMYELMGQRKLHDEAVNIALQRMGHHGHKFLLQRLNDEDPKNSLSYVDRHRALDELAGDSQSMSLVNLQLNLARDLWQARYTATPCLAFSTVLDQLAAVPDAYFLVPLRKAKVPEARAETEDAAICPALGAKLALVQQQYEQQFGDAANATIVGESAPPEGAPKPAREGGEDDPGAVGDTPAPAAKPAPGPAPTPAKKKSAPKKKKKKNPFQELGDAFRGG